MGNTFLKSYEKEPDPPQQVTFNLYDEEYDEEDIYIDDDDVYPTTQNNENMNKKYFTWGNAFYTLLFLTTLTSVIVFFVMCVSNKKTIQYSLGSKNQVLIIIKECNWSPDDEITIDRSVTYGEAIRMVDSLNKTLK